MWSIPFLPNIQGNLTKWKTFISVMKTGLAFSRLAKKSYYKIKSKEKMENIR